MPNQRTKFSKRSASSWKETEIGMIPEDWKIFRLKDLGKVITGKTPPTKEPSNYGGSIPFVCIPDMGQSVEISNTSKYISGKGLRTVKNCLLPKKSVMVSCIATIGKVGIVSRPSITNQQINSIVPNNKINPKFLYYRLSNFENILSKYGGGGAVFEIVSKSKFEEIPLSIPYISEQEKIAGVLGVLDEKIELNRKMNKTLEEIGKTVFKQALLKSRSKQQIIERPLGELLETIESGRRPKGGVSKYKEGTPSIGAENINGLGNYEKAKEKYVPDEFFKNMKSGVLRHKDILIYKDGAHIGRKTIYRDNFPHENCCINEHVFILRTKNPELQNYLYFYLDLPKTTEKIVNLNSNAAQPGINQAQVKSMGIEILNNKELKSLNDILENLLEKIYKNAKENSNLSQIRDSLLPKLMSGKVRVK